jgi:hypothetical protein
MLAVRVFWRHSGIVQVGVGMRYVGARTRPTLSLFFTLGDLLSSMIKTVGKWCTRAILANVLCHSSKYH